MKSHLKKVYSSLPVLMLLFMCYDLNTRQQKPITVDIQRVVRQTAEGFAKAKIPEAQLEQQIHAFKRDLNESLREFAKHQNTTVVAAHVIHGEIKDMTDAFIAFHNDEPTSSTVASREAKK
jgi:hypothetical protein